MGKLFSFYRTVALLTGLFTASSALAQVDGIWNFRGQSPSRGSYSGQLELRSSRDGSVQAIRVVTYDSFRFEDARVQEVWTGTGFVRGSSVALHFSLKQAEFLKSIGTETRDPSLFRQELAVDYEFPLWNAQYRLHIKGEALSEVTSGERRPLGPAPLWMNERQALYSKGTEMPAVLSAAWRLLIEPVVRDYRQDPYVQSWSHRREFQEEAQYFILDPTDFDFYRREPGVLRVVNKISDAISLTESNLRRMAYAPTLAQKAQHFDHDMARFHINELGLFSSAQYDEKGNFAGYGGDGDGALWSGMYAGSQAMRYLTTRDPEALENYRRVLRGMLLLMDVTGDNQFARTAHPMSPGEKLEGVWRQGVAPYQHVKYIEGGNNDMFKGLVHAMAWASHVLPANDPLLADTGAHARRLPGMAIVESAKQNRSVAYGLAALYSHEASLREEYIKAYEKIEKPSDFLGISEGFYYGGVADWSGINLGMTGTITEILIAQEMMAKFPSEAPNRWERIVGKFTEHDILNRSRETLMKQWNTYSSTRRDFLTIAAYAFAYRHGTRGFGYSEDGRSKEEAESTWSKRESWDRTLSQSVWSLREMPIPRSEYDLVYDHTLRPDWCLSAWPRLPWKSVKERQPWNYHYQGVFYYPLFEGNSLGSNWVWKDSAFPLTGSDSVRNRYAGGDYLYTYWMARMSGLFSDDERAGQPVPPPPPPPARKYVEYRLGDGTADKFKYREFSYDVPAQSEPVLRIRFASNKADTRVDHFIIHFADNGEERRIGQFEGVLHHDEVKLVELEGRPLSRVRVKVISGKVSGSRGEFRVELGVMRQ